MGATETLDAALSSRGRRLKPAYPALRHLNPVRQVVLAGAARPRELPPYLRLATPSALPVLAVRSCHLPRDHTTATINHYAGDRCTLCGCAVLHEVGSGEYTAEERK